MKRPARTPKNSRRLTCGDCRVREGDLHERGCDMERCPVCGGQCISCGCAERHFYPSYNDNVDADMNLLVPFCGVPPEVFSDGLSKAQLDEWDRVLAAKGRVPFIVYPNLCGRCGVHWPEMFRVPDLEWKQYIEPHMRSSMLCRVCYDWIKRVVNSARGRRIRAAVRTPAEVAE